MGVVPSDQLVVSQVGRDVRPAVLPKTLIQYDLQHLELRAVVIASLRVPADIIQNYVAVAMIGQPLADRVVLPQRARVERQHRQRLRLDALEEVRLSYADAAGEQDAVPLQVCLQYLQRLRAMVEAA